MSAPQPERPQTPVPGAPWAPHAAQAPSQAPRAALPSPDPVSRWMPAAVPGWLAVVGSVVLGGVVGVVAVLWQGWAAVLTNPGVIVLPWGALLGALVVFATAVAWGLRCARRWVPGVVGLCAFAVLGLVSMDQHNQLLAPLDPRYFQIVPGAVWSAIVVVGGVIVATIAALLVVSRHVAPVPRRR